MRRLLVLLLFILCGAQAALPIDRGASHFLYSGAQALGNIWENQSYNESSDHFAPKSVSNRSIASYRSNDFFSSFQLIADSWRSNFFTDDSRYYLKLYSDGMVQRVRFHKDFCAGVDDISFEFKKGDVETETYLLGRDEAPNWPSLYGINSNDYCWFKLTATGLDLNRPKDNLYVIRVVYNGETYYIGGIRDSILPGKRVFDSLDGIPWISLGGHGATPVEDGGVFYKIWEPEVERVDLFINGSNKAIQLKQDFAPQKNELRSHAAYVHSSSAGDEYLYKFVVNGEYTKQVFSNNMSPTAIKVDPMAKEIVYERKGGELNGYYRPRAVVQGDISYPWQNDHSIKNLSRLDRENRIIYQVWPLTFNPKKVRGKYVGGTFDDISEKLGYINDLGVNTVELLPIHEGKFYAGWGYSLDSILLIEKGYGPSDSLKKLSDSLHSKKIQLILDVVLNHVNNSLIRDPIGRYDDQSKFFNGSTDWGPRPRFSSIGVQKWVADSLVSLIRDFHIDGYRFDMTKYIYNLGGNPAGYKFLQDLNYLLKQVHPEIYLSAEELPDNVWVTKPQVESGLGFDSQWNDKFKNVFEEEFAHLRPYNQKVNLSPLLGAMYGYSNHVDYGTEYNFGDPLKTVNYLGSHDFIGNKNPILRLVSDYNFYEQVDRNYFSRVRPLEDPTYERFSLIHNDFTHSVGRAAYGILFTKPGAILFYQGEELGNDINIQNEWSYINAKQNNSIPSQNVDISRFVGSHKMPWEYLDPFNSEELAFLPNEDKKLFSGHYKFFKDLIRFRRDHPKLNHKNAYDVQLSHDGEILTYLVDDGVKKFFVVANFGGDKNGEWVSFPRGGDSWWLEIYNSSEEQYSGKPSIHRNVIANLGGRANHLRLKANSIMVYERSSRGQISVPLYLRGSMSNWNVSKNLKLEESSEHGDVYSLTLTVKNAGEHEFKIASNDWSIEYGAPVRGANVERFGRDLSGQLSNMANMPNIKVTLEKGRYRFLFSIVDFKFSFLYIE